MIKVTVVLKLLESARNKTYATSGIVNNDFSGLEASSLHDSTIINVQE